MPNLNFKCPHCSRTKIEEVMDDVVVASVLTAIEVDHGDYGEQTNYGGLISRFQCESCGSWIFNIKGEPVTTYDELYSVCLQMKWIKEQ